MTILDKCEELEAEALALRCEDADPEDLRTAARWLEEYYGFRFPVSGFRSGAGEARSTADAGRSATQAMRRSTSALKWPDGFFPKTGVAVRRGGETLVVIPVYLEATSRVAVAGHFTAAPGLPPRLLREAAQTAVRGCQVFARRHGRPFLIAIWGRRSISRIAAQCGFRNADTVQEQLFIDKGE